LVRLCKEVKKSVGRLPPGQSVGKAKTPRKARAARHAAEDTDEAEANTGRLAELGRQFLEDCGGDWRVG
jgi:hypothetical protein